MAASDKIISGIRWLVNESGELVGYRNVLTDTDTLFPAGTPAGQDISDALDTLFGSTDWRTGGPGEGTVSDWGDIAGTLADQTDLQSALDDKADLASPTFTGTPAAPTATTGTNTTQIATTAFVLAEIAALVDSSPAALNTLNEIAAALGDDADFAGTMVAALALKAPAANPAFTGVIDLGDGAEAWTPSAMDALAIDVTKRFNTKSVSADSTLTFSATPSANRVFGMLLANTSSTVAVRITIPSSVPNGGGSAITAFSLPAGTRIYLSWRYDGTDYTVFGVPGAGSALNAVPPANGLAEGTTIFGLQSAAAIAQWETVYLNSSSKWALADANGSGTYPARGLAIAAVGGADTLMVVLVNGTVRNDSWNWTPGAPLYLSATAGGITATAPSTSGDKVQVIGFALTADTAYFDFDSTYVQVT